MIYVIMKQNDEVVVTNGWADYTPRWFPVAYFSSNTGAQAALNTLAATGTGKERYMIMGYHGCKEELAERLTIHK